MTLDYEIIASGSKGNCVKIEDVMVDIGVSFKRVKEQLYETNYLIITHIHSDHLNIPTVKKIKQFFPHIEIIGNWEVAQKIEVNHLINAGYQVYTDDYTFNAFELSHDVLCYGYFWNMKGKSIIYATDTNNMRKAPDEKFDYIFIESNYNPNKIKMAKSTKGYDPKLSALRHLSTFDSKEFYFTHRRNKESKWIELHKSERFY